MSKLLELTKMEFKHQNTTHNLTKYLSIFFLFCVFSITLINTQEDMSKFGILFSVIYLPLSLLGFSKIAFKYDFDDGSLELLLSSFSEVEIVLAKALSITANATLSTLVNLPIVAIIFNLSMTTLLHLGILLILLVTLASSLLIMLGAMQSYFKANTNFLSLLIIPLLIPTIVMSGLVIQTPANAHLLWVILGINMVIIPTSLALSTYLVKNIYNI